MTSRNGDRPYPKPRPKPAMPVEDYRLYGTNLSEWLRKAISHACKHDILAATEAAVILADICTLATDTEITKKDLDSAALFGSWVRTMFREAQSRPPEDTLRDALLLRDSLIDQLLAAHPKGEKIDKDDEIRFKYIMNRFVTKDPNGSFEIIASSEGMIMKLAASPDGGETAILHNIERERRRGNTENVELLSRLLELPNEERRTMFLRLMSQGNG